MEENLVLLFFLILPPVLLVALQWYFKEGLARLKGRKVLALLFGNLLVLLFLLSLIILPGEIYFRFFYDRTDSFGLCKTTERWFERHFQKNRTGFRDSVNYMPKIEPGKRRVTFVGDSFTAGHGIANVEDRFANHVRAEHPQLEVHVLAQCGWDTGMELDLVNFIPTSGYESNMVVLVYCLNDISDIVPEWQQILDRIYKLPKPGFFATHSYLFNTINARLRMAMEPEIVDYYSFVQRAYEGPIWDRQAGRLQSLRKAITDGGGELVVVTFPFLHDLGDDYRYRDVHQRLNDFWTEQGVPHLDLLSTYIQQPPEQMMISARDVHPNEKAHALAATAIGAFIDEQLQP